MIFGKYLKLHVLIFTVFCCRLPLCRVNTPILHILIPLFCFTFWILYWWFGLVFWFDFNNKLFNRTTRLFYFYVEVWKVTMYSTIPWRPVRYDNTDAILEWGSEEVIIPYRSPWDGRINRYFPDF